MILANKLFKKDAKKIPPKMGKDEETGL